MTDLALDQAQQVDVRRGLMEVLEWITENGEADVQAFFFVAIKREAGGEKLIRASRGRGKVIRKALEQAIDGILAEHGIRLG